MWNLNSSSFSNCEHINEVAFCTHWNSTAFLTLWTCKHQNLFSKFLLLCYPRGTFWGADSSPIVSLSQWWAFDSFTAQFPVLDYFIHLRVDQPIPTFLRQPIKVMHPFSTCLPRLLPSSNSSFVSCRRKWGLGIFLHHPLLLFSVSHSGHAPPLPPPCWTILLHKLRTKINLPTLKS